jgi:predicted transcriptional regulator
MAKNKVKRLVVLEQERSMAGVLSVTDISRKLAKVRS